MRFFAPLVLFSLLAPGLLGCPNTDAAVFVDPSIASPSLTVGMPSVLVTGITGGGFTLDLHLGPRASGPSTATLGEFTIVDAATRQTTLVASLPIQAAGGAFATGSTVVEPGSDDVTMFTIPMKQTDIKPICMAGQIVVAGSISDSLMGGTTPTPVYSPAFAPTGCPQ